MQQSEHDNNRDLAREELRKNCLNSCLKRVAAMFDMSKVVTQEDPTHREEAVTAEVRKRKRPDTEEEHTANNADTPRQRIHIYSCVCKAFNQMGLAHLPA